MTEPARESDYATKADLEIGFAEIRAEALRRRHLA